MRKPGIYFGFLICALVLLCGENSFAEALYGKWSGIVQQFGPGDYKGSYFAEITLEGNSGKMNYPTLGCGGELSFENEKEGIVSYREHISYGQKKCIDGGLIAVRPSGDSLQWAWNGPQATASGILAGIRNMLPCDECVVLRGQCFVGCDKETDLLKRGKCVEKCKKEYECLKGRDCK